MRSVVAGLTAILLAQCAAAAPPCSGKLKDVSSGHPTFISSLLSNGSTSTALPSPLTETATPVTTSPPLSGDSTSSDPPSEENVDSENGESQEDGPSSGDLPSGEDGSSTGSDPSSEDGNSTSNESQSGKDGDLTGSSTGAMDPGCKSLSPAPNVAQVSMKESTLWYINWHRCNHTDTKPIAIWNETLARWAEECAGQCESGGHCMAPNAPGIVDGVVPYEQIVFDGSDTSFNAANAVDTWYYGSPGDGFNDEFNSDGTPTGFDTHGSRIIWKSSTEVGCGVSNCPSAPLRVVCHFGDGTLLNRASSNIGGPEDKARIIANLGTPLGHPNPAQEDGLLKPGTPPF